MDGPASKQIAEVPVHNHDRVQPTAAPIAVDVKPSAAGESVGPCEGSVKLLKASGLL